MFISYAQNFEDVMLWRALKHVVSGFYIDVGAAWPNEHSVTKAFYDAGWSGINVEPNPAFHALLLQERPRDHNLQLALAEQEGNADFVIFEATGLSTLDPVVASLHQDAGRPHETQTVHTSTLAQLWHRYVPEGQEVHFVKIDVEGAEAAVLRGNNWQKNRPWIVVIEATVPMSQVESYADWEPVLLQAQYRWAYADGLNRFYVASERAELLAAFQYPPNFFDNFKLSDHYAAELRAGLCDAAAQQAREQATQAQEQAAQAQEQAAQAQQQAAQAQEKAAQAQQRESEANARAEQAQTQAQEANAQAAQAQAQALVHEQQKNASELQAALLQEQIDALHQSYSWRMTSPLRAILGYFRQHPRK